MLLHSPKRNFFTVSLMSTV